MDGFCWYATRMVRKNFYFFGVDSSAMRSFASNQDVPLIVYANHPGWWDPIVAMLLCKKYFKTRDYFAPIDGESLRKYRVFRKLGYFGIEANSRKGSTEFLEMASHVLKSKNRSLWITPEGRFTDVRDYVQPLMPGLAHIAAKTDKVHCIPLAIEYVFIEERQPLLLCKFGSVIADSGPIRTSKDEWQSRLTEALRRTQNELANNAIAKNWNAFDAVVRSKRCRL